MTRTRRARFRKTLTGTVLFSVVLVACGPSPVYWERAKGPSRSGAQAAVYAPNSPRPIPRPSVKPRRAKAAPKPIARPAVRPSVKPARGYVTVKVRKGDTVYALARRHGAVPKDIIRANKLRRPYHLNVGQSVKVPRARVHVVAKGETGYSISRRYGVDVSSLMQLNQIRRPYRLKIGQKLKLPRQTRQPVAVASAGSSKAPTPPPPPRSGAGFAWPAYGKVISSYGAKAGGLHNDGINIRVSAGAPVRASDSGTVVYVGNELKGFGNLVLIRHAGGWVSAYGHNRELLVSRGEKVSRGQTVAKAGASGSVTSPQVHFELRKGSRAVDPQKYLPPIRAGISPGGPLNPG